MNVPFARQGETNRMASISKNSMAQDLTRGRIFTIMIRLAIPITLSNLLQTVYSMVDMIVVGQYEGSAGLSAVTVSSQVIMLMTMFVMGFTSAGQVLISQQVGAEDHAGMKKAIGTLFTSVAAIAVIMTVVGLTLYGPMLQLLNVPEESFKQASQYMIICSAGIVFTYGYNTVSAILRGMGDAKRPFIFIAIASVLNVVLDLLFVGPMGMKAAGAALATVVAQAISFIISIAYLYRHRSQFGFDFKPKSFCTDMNVLKILFKLGFPMAIQHSAISISMLFVNGFVNVYGLVASATFGVGRRVEMIPNMLTQSIMMVASTMIGQNIAAGEVKRSKSTVYCALLINICVSIVVFIAFVLWPRQIFSIFTQDTDVLNMAALFMSTALIGIPARCLMHAFAPFIQGIGNARLNLILGLSDGVVARIGLCLLLERVAGLGMYGLFLGYCLATYVTAIPSVVYFFSGAWKKRKLLVSKLKQ